MSRISVRAMGTSVRWAACAAVSILGACGGGGSSTPTPTPLTSIDLAGTAVKGAALSGATVSVRCASGTASGTTSATGAYSVTVSGATLPCAIRVSDGAGAVYHSIVPGTATTGSFTANVTPLTDLLVARLGGVAPGTYFDAFGSGASVNAFQVNAAADYVRAAVSGAADLGTADLVSGPLDVGDAMDQKIDAVVAALAAAGLSQAEAAAAVVANPTAPSVLTAAMAPAATDCPAFRSGRYRAVDMIDGTSGIAVIDATTLSGTDPGGVPFQAVAEAPCRYVIDEPDWITRLAVAPGGAIVVSGQSKSTSERAMGIAFPDQTLPMSEWAGAWNALSWEPATSSSDRVGTVHVATLDASGQFISLLDCVGLAACTAQAGPFSHLVVNTAQGGFDEILTGGGTWSRAFLYKNVSGRKFAVFITPDRQFIIGAPQASLGALPSVGTATSFRDVQMSGTLGLTVSNDTNTVTAVDTATRVVTRQRSSDNRVDRRRYDSPRDGLRHRIAGDCSVSGIPVNCAEVVQLPLQGMGISAVTGVSSDPANAFFVLSANDP